ncbi:MAG: gliding motility-associated C-terminal domain-containing protein [Chitinophagales bacterium]
MGGAIEETKLLYAWSFENYLVDEFHLKIEPIVLYTTQGNYIFFNTATVDEVCNTGWSINAVHVNYCTPITNFTVPSTTICEGEGILFKDASQKVPENWNWYFEGADVPFATEQNSGAFYSTAGVYDVQLITSNPVGSDTLLLKDYITVLPDPNNLVEIQNFDYQINEGESVQLTICDTSDTYIYRWNPPTYLSCSDCPNPIASPPTNVEYTAIIHQVYTSCEMECLHNVVVAGLELIVPTAFSPNADDINDVLKPISSLAEVLRFTVYNRWGQKIYEGAGDSAAWNGTFKNQNAPIGSYVWTVEYLPKNETAPRLEQGFVVLVR